MSTINQLERKMNCSNTKMAKICLNEYMPPEVLSLILAKLPAKTVITIRCVCKSWCSFIDHPNFFHLHLKHCNTNQSNSGKLLSLERLGSTRYGGCLLTLREAGTLRIIDQIFKTSEKYNLIGTCHSLLLINRSQNFLNKGMTLCNPSVKKSLLLPPCPLLPCDGYTPTFVLGFATRSEDYKIIAIAFKQPQGIEVPEMRVVVYALNGPQWAVRDNGLNIDYSSFKHLFGPYYFCEGAAHWLGNALYGDTTNEFDYPTHLVSLDFDSEKFTFLDLPAALDDIDTTSGSLFLLGDSLAFFCISLVRFRIWVLKQESGRREWALWFSGCSSSDGFDLFDYMRSTTQRVLYCEGDGGYLIYWKKSYNIRTCQVRELGQSMSHDVDLTTYFESLVFCNGYGTNQSNCDLTVADDPEKTLAASDLILVD